MRELKKYTDKQFITLLEQLSLYELNADEEVLHRIRVALKKIKTIFHIISFCSKNFDAHKEFSPLKKIFKDAGNIREIDVTEKLLKEYNIKSNFESTNAGKREKLTSVFRKNIPVYKKFIFDVNIIAGKHFVRVSTGCFREFINLRKSELQGNVYPLLVESNLHKSRKIIKDIIYLSALSRWRKKNLNPLYDEMQEVIGKWHDKIMLMCIIKENNYDPSGKVRRKLNLKTVSDLKNIESMVKNIYSRDGSERMVIYKDSN